MIKDVLEIIDEKYHIKVKDNGMCQNGSTVKYVFTIFLDKAQLRFARQMIHSICSNANRKMGKYAEELGFDCKTTIFTNITESRDVSFEVDYLIFRGNRISLYAFISEYMGIK